jgi:hypothetical protein
MPDAAHGFTDRAESRLGGARSRLSEPGDVHEDDAGIVDGERVIRQTPPVDGAGLEVLEHDVAVPRDPPHQDPAAFVTQIDRHRALVARDRGPPEALDATIVLGHAYAVAPHDVAGRRRLDFHDVGAEIAEQLARERAGDERPELEHAQAGQLGVAHGRQGNLPRSRRFQWTSRRAHVPKS